MAMTPDELIDTSMMLIVHSGDARAAAFHALQEAKAGNFEEAKKLMAESKAKALEAHHIQTGLLMKGTAKARRSPCCWSMHRIT